MLDLNKVISSAIKSGKIFIGTKQTLEAAKSGRAAAIIVASNCPTETLISITKYSNLSGIPLCAYPASSLDMGTACKKPFAILALAIRETNDPDIRRMKQELSDAIANKSVI